MWNSPKGYVFESKPNLKTAPKYYDENGNPVTLLGIKEDFVYSFKGEIETVKLTVGMDSKFNICRPSFFDTSAGLTPLDRIINAETRESDMIKFLRSNRAVYSVTPLFICTLQGRYNRNTGTWDESTICNFYVQRNSGFLQDLVKNEDFGTKRKECVIADVLSPFKGLFTFNNPELSVDDRCILKDTLTYSLLKTITPFIYSKEAFLLARL